MTVTFWTYNLKRLEQQVNVHHIGHDKQPGDGRQKVTGSPGHWPTLHGRARIVSKLWWSLVHCITWDGRKTVMWDVQGLLVVKTRCTGWPLSQRHSTIFVNGGWKTMDFYIIVHAHTILRKKQLWYSILLKDMSAMARNQSHTADQKQLSLNRPWVIWAQFHGSANRKQGIIACGRRESCVYVKRISQG